MGYKCVQLLLWFFKPWPQHVYIWLWGGNCSLYSSIMAPQSSLSCLVVCSECNSCVCGRVPHLTSPPVSADPCYCGWQTDPLLLSERLLEVWEGRLFSPLQTWNIVTVLLRWPLTVRQPAPCSMLAFISSIQFSSVSQPLLRERRGGRPGAPQLQSIPLSTSHPTPGVWCHPPPSPHLILNILSALYHPPPFISYSLVLIHAAGREDAWFMKLYFYQFLRRKREGEAATKEMAKKGKRRRMESVRSEPKVKEDRRVWGASPRWRRTGECGADIHHPATPSAVNEDEEKVETEIWWIWPRLDEMYCRVQEFWIVTPSTRLDS